MLRRLQVVESPTRILEIEDLLVHDRLQINLVLCKEIAQILLILRRSDTNAPAIND